MIRLARREDTEAMLQIYAPFVQNTAVSLEFDVPTPEEFMARFDSITRHYPWLVWKEGGRVLGYAYASRALERAAYQWDADVSIYMAEEARHTGAAHRLYQRLEAIMTRLGYFNLYALITAGNTDSRQFHERRGYRLEGVLRCAGYKFGQWHDLCWYALHLKEGEDPADGPVPFDPAMLEE